jgi:hypothetical protein
MGQSPSSQTAPAPPTRFAGLRPFQAALLLAALAALFAIGLIQPRTIVGASAAPTGIVGSDRPVDAAGDDILLYRVIVDHVRSGQDYYRATATLLRDNHYPLKPFFTFRLPTLAFLLAFMPDWLGIAVLAGLGAATIFLWTVRLGQTGAADRPVMIASLLLLAGCVTVASPSLSGFHESWAALLLALSLVLHRPGRWLPSVALALLAVMIRELALPFLLLMGAAALWYRRWSEVAAWAFAVSFFAIGLVVHSHAVSAVVLASDAASPGWLTPGGWTYVLAAMRAATILGYLPAFLSAVLVPLALLGWLSQRDSAVTLAGLFLAGFMAMMTVFGRPDNFYWAAMIVPLLLAGLAFAPAALRDLFAAIPGLSRARRSARL